MATDTVAPAHLPAPKELRDLLRDLVDREVTLRPGPPFAVSDFYPASIATFVDARLTVRAAVALDLPLSAFAGAAAALVPVATATSAIQAGAVTGSLSTSLSEACSVLASLFNVGNAPHLRLYAAHLAGAALPADARMRTQVLGRRADFYVTVAGYGTGRLAIVLSS